MKAENSWYRENNPFGSYKHIKDEKLQARIEWFLHPDKPHPVLSLFTGIPLWDPYVFDDIPIPTTKDARFIVHTMDLYWPGYEMAGSDPSFDFGIIGKPGFSLLTRSEFLKDARVKRSLDLIDRSVYYVGASGIDTRAGVACFVSGVSIAMEEIRTIHNPDIHHHKMLHNMRDELLGYAFQVGRNNPQSEHTWNTLVALNISQLRQSR